MEGDIRTVGPDFPRDYIYAPTEPARMRVALSGKEWLC